jgi:hypothetical protein
VGATTLRQGCDALQRSRLQLLALNAVGSETEGNDHGILGLP